MDEAIPKVSRSLMHEMVLQDLHYKKLSTKWILKKLTDNHKKEILGSINVLFRYRYRGHEFLHHIVAVMNYGSLILHVKVGSSVYTGDIQVMQNIK